jgi:hypothetical protein
VDKTLLIRDLIDGRSMVTLFTRPRRFGKTLAINMIKTFFEKSEEDTSRYFIDKKIWQCGEKYRSMQGKYPVIMLTFKDVKYDTWEESMEAIRLIIYDQTEKPARADKLRRVLLDRFDETHTRESDASARRRFIADMDDRPYQLRGENKTKAQALGLPVEYNRLALMCVSVFHLSHWRLDVTVTNYLVQ